MKKRHAGRLSTSHWPCCLPPPWRSEFIPGRPDPAVFARPALCKGVKPSGANAGAHSATALRMASIVPSVTYRGLHAEVRPMGPGRLALPLPACPGTHAAVSWLPGKAQSGAGPPRPHIPCHLCLPYLLRASPCGRPCCRASLAQHTKTLGSPAYPFPAAPPQPRPTAPPTASPDAPAV